MGDQTDHLEQTIDRLFETLFFYQDDDSSVHERTTRCQTEFYFQTGNQREIINYFET